MLGSLKPRIRNGGQITELPEGGWRLQIPEGNESGYRLAQLDDTASLPRRRLLWKPPCKVEFQARLSSNNLPGTWGFGFWNEPFSMGGSLAGAGRVLPALPQCAWFFSASNPNHLSFYENVPADGFFAGVMRSKRLPTWLFIPGIPGLPLLLLRPVARFLRRTARRLIRQEGISIQVDVREWHSYSLDWKASGVQYELDGEPLLTSSISPVSPLGLVIWIDNQFAAFTPEGRIRFGVLANPECWMEVRII